MADPAGRESMNRLAVVGHPVAHSLSPAMHNAAFAELGRWLREPSAKDVAILDAFLALAAKVERFESLDEVRGSRYRSVTSIRLRD